MSRTICNFIVSQLLFDLFARFFLFLFVIVVANTVAETPHRTKVRLQNEENAPVVPPNKKFLFSKMKAGKYGSIDTEQQHDRSTYVKPGCDTPPPSFMGNQDNLGQRRSEHECDVTLQWTYGFWRIDDVTKCDFPENTTADAR